MDYPNTCLSWFTRQLDLELMFTSTISLRTANWIKWEKLFTDLVALSTGSTYSLALFIRFGGFIYRMYLLALFNGFLYSLAVFIRFGGSSYWIYLLDLFIGFTYSLALYIRFGGFIYLPYLWTLVSAYTVFMLIANLVSFSHISERNTSTFLSIYISHVLMEKIFRPPLRHHSCLIKLTLLQLHHHTLLIKLTNAASLHHIPYTYPLIKLTHITSLHHNCYTRSISKLYHSNITSITCGTLRNCFSYPATSTLIQVRDQSTKTQYSVPSAPEKLTEGHSRIWHLPAPTRIAAHVVIKPVTSINRPNSSCERFWSLYHLEMSGTWLWNRRSHYTTCSRLWTTKSTLSFWKILLRLHESYPYPLSWSSLSLHESILR